MHPIPFPIEDLIYNGKVMRDSSKLSDCGIKESSLLELVVHASEHAFTEQLTDLLQARDLSIEELGLFYSYKNGASVMQALKFIGHEGTLQDFVSNQKQFMMENDTVVLVRDDTVLKPSSVANAKQTAASCGTNNMPPGFFAPEKPVDSTKSLQRLRCLTSKSRQPRCGRGQAPISAAQQAQPCTTGPPQACQEDIQGYTDLQNGIFDLYSKICSGFFHGDIARAVNHVVAAIAEALFLNIHHVVTGGSVGKGTAILGKADADVVLFVCGLPKIGHKKWLPPLLRSMANFLTGSFDAGDSLEDVCVSEHSVRMVLKGFVSVDLYISPVFESYAETIQVLGKQAPCDQKYYAASLAKERTEFITSQPDQVKMTVRLMRCWRDQQEWSSQKTRPSDAILELMAVYSETKTKPTDEKAAIANLRHLAACFDKLRVVWKNYYQKDEVEAPLLQERPLLMDPVNPTINVADPKVFDPSELMALAHSAPFFWS